MNFSKIVMYSAVMFLGIYLGQKKILKKYLSKKLGIILNVLLIILLLIMGITLGKNEVVINQISVIGFRAFIMTSFIVLFSVITLNCVIRVYKIILKKTSVKGQKK